MESEDYSACVGSSVIEEDSCCNNLINTTNVPACVDSVGILFVCFFGTNTIVLSVNEGHSVYWTISTNQENIIIVTAQPTKQNLPDALSASCFLVLPQSVVLAHCQ